MLLSNLLPKAYSLCFLKYHGLSFIKLKESMSLGRCWKLFNTVPFTDVRGGQLVHPPNVSSFHHGNHPHSPQFTELLLHMRSPASQQQPVKPTLDSKPPPQVNPLLKDPRQRLTRSRRDTHAPTNAHGFQYSEAFC